MNTEQVIQTLNEQHEAILKHNKDQAEKLAVVEEEMHKLLTRGNKPGGGGGFGQKTLGEQFIASADYQSDAPKMVDKRGKMQLSLQRDTITSANAGALIAPDRRPEVVVSARQATPVRALIAPGTTGSNLVQYARQSLRTLNADVVSEGVTKPESFIEFELEDAPVRTIAHWTIASRQVWTDSSMLRSIIDGELRFGLETVEETQLLWGSGTGQELHGIATQATAFSEPFSVDDKNRADELLQAIAQVQTGSLLPASGIVLNDLDYYRMLALKDGEGRYLGTGPFGAQLKAVAWTLPISLTPTMPAGQFLVGAFASAAQLFDRETIEVMVSSEDSDNFRKNLVTVLAEERLALAVKRPAAFVTGSFTVAT